MRDCDEFYPSDDEVRSIEMQRLAPVSLASPSKPSPSPDPTAPPHPILVARRLQQRSTSLTTCGWVNGNFCMQCSSPSSLSSLCFLLSSKLTRSLSVEASPVTCSTESSCFSFTSQSIFACCAFLDECFPPTTCIDSTAFVNDCNNTCQADLSTLKW